MNLVWDGTNLEQVLQRWLANPMNHPFKALPLIKKLGLVDSKKQPNIHRKQTIPEMTTINNLNILTFFSTRKGH